MERYGTVEGFKAYHLARMRVVTQFEDDEINGGLLVGSEWIDGTYRLLFPGLKSGGSAQIREWGRDGAFDIYAYSIANNTVPFQIEHATYEAALKQLNKPGSLLVDYTPGKYKRVSVDGAVSVEYASFDGASAVQTQFATIDMLLMPILTGNRDGAGMSGLSGGTSRV